MCRVSIIVPIFNSEYTLTKCINSILMQSFTDFELILINDGSTDNSLEICNEFKKVDNRIKVINKENEGVSKARNLGLESAKGDYIQFVDSDDYIEKDFLKDNFNTIIKNNVDWVISGLKKSKGNKIENIIPSVLGYFNIDEFMSYYIVLSIDSIMPYNVNKLYKKEIIEENNLRFDEKVKYTEDHLFNLKYVKYIRSVYISTSCQYIYCIDESRKSLSTRYKRYYFKNRMNVSNEIKKVLIYYNKYNLSIKKQFENFYINYVIIYTIKDIISANYDIKTAKILLNEIFNEKGINILLDDSKLNLIQKVIIILAKRKMIFSLKFLVYFRNFTKSLF